MKKTIKKTLLILLVVHGFGINVIGAILYYLFFHPVDLGNYGILWLVSFQLNAFCFYYYKKCYPDKVDSSQNQPRSPWITDFFKSPQ